MRSSWNSQPIHMLMTYLFTGLQCDGRLYHTSQETRSLGNWRCFPPPPSGFSHIFSSFILFWTFWIWVPIVEVTVRLQPLSHFFIQNKQAGALSDGSSDLQESFSTVVAAVWQIKLGSVKSARRKAWLTIHSNWKSQIISCYHREEHILLPYRDMLHLLTVR